MEPDTEDKLLLAQTSTHYFICYNINLLGQSHQESQRTSNILTRSVKVHVIVIQLKLSYIINIAVCVVINTFLSLSKSRN